MDNNRQPVLSNVELALTRKSATSEFHIIRKIPNVWSLVQSRQSEVKAVQGVQYAMTIIHKDTKLLYYTLIYPYLHNGLHLWGATYQTYTNSLSTLQKRAVRLIVNAPRLEHTLPIFQKLELLPLHKLYDYCLGKYMYSHIYEIAPVLFLNEILLNSDVHQYNTRSAKKAHVQFFRTEKVKK